MRFILPETHPLRGKPRVEIPCQPRVVFVDGVAEVPDDVAAHFIPILTRYHGAEVEGGDAAISAAALAAAESKVAAQVEQDTFAKLAEAGTVTALSAEEACERIRATEDVKLLRAIYVAEGLGKQRSSVADALTERLAILAPRTGHADKLDG